MEWDFLYGLTILLFFSNDKSMRMSGLHSTPLPSHKFHWQVYFRLRPPEGFNANHDIAHETQPEKENVGDRQTNKMLI